ncbi:hypothetical protein [Nodosilinea sp. E11]|uniref:hypothetical protein n=1 Tax=Nodosilinea sp. E11 TaxID=3037479 RepID=UPI002934D2E3|nr:hypothetical protein [Nodosilinea sp. E11]WOD39026.1 hypothetical protein RRF56_22735 [Nodosilinea sp. E11]
MTLLKVWITQKLTGISRWLGNVWGVNAQSTQSAASGNTWTPETLARFGLEMSKGFGSGV